MSKKVAAKTSKKTKGVSKKTAAAPKIETLVPPPPIQAPLQVAPTKTEADKIWEEIKNLPIQMFGLPFQVVANHCQVVRIEPNRLYLTIRSTATLPSLETAIAPKFVVELADKWVIVTRAKPTLNK